MAAYLALTLAVLSRLLPSLAHGVGRNLTAVGGSLLFFGARRPRRELPIAAVALAATDFFLTTVAFHVPFHARDYAVTWLWYLLAPLVGRALLRGRRPGGRRNRLTLAGRAAAATLASAASFFLLSNGAFWAQTSFYPHTLAGVAACYAAGLPFLRNDVLSTGLTLGALLTSPALARAVRRSPRAAWT